MRTEAGSEFYAGNLLVLPDPHSALLCPAVNPKKLIHTNNINQLSKETHMLTKQDFAGKGHLGRDQQGPGHPGGLLCHVACSLGFYGDVVSFQVVSGQSL